MNIFPIKFSCAGTLCCGICSKWITWIFLNVKCFLMLKTTMKLRPTSDLSIFYCLDAQDEGCQSQKQDQSELRLAPICWFVENCDPKGQLLKNCSPWGRSQMWMEIKLTKSNYSPFLDELEQRFLPRILFHLRRLRHLRSSKSMF